MKNSDKSLFAELLLKWNAHANKREMPWKEEKDPYKIWLSEIILQQTRVEQGWNYYLRFINKFPNIKALANTNDDEVFKLWEGLGYYNRCKNLLSTARYISNEYDGIFPKEYDHILKLKGVGTYTASAICSFAYNQPYAVVDGNVFRVLSRYFGIVTPIDSAAGKKEFSLLAQSVLDKNNAAQYNQAIMDFGAVLCKFSKPLCGICPLESSCSAHLKGLVNHLPVKEKRINKKIRYFTWLKINVKNELLIYQRTAKDIWQNLFEFYLIENEESPSWSEQDIELFCYNIFNQAPVSVRLGDIEEQQLTHQKIKGQVIEVELNKKPDVLKKQRWVNKNKLKELAFPKILNDYLKRENA